MSKSCRVGKYFVIRSKLRPEMVLEIQDGVDKPGIPIVTSEFDSACVDYQHWFWDKSTETIRSKHNSFCIDVKEGVLVAQPYQRGEPSQLWVIVEDRIQTAEDFEVVISIEGNVPKIHSRCITSEYNNEDGQHWKIEHTPAQYFYIRCGSDPRKVLDVKGDSEKPGAKVIIYPDKGTRADNQLWYEDEDAIIRSKLNGYILDATGKQAIMLPLDKTNPNQQWTISGSSIQNRADKGKVLEMKPAGGLGLGLLGEAHLIAADYSPSQQYQQWTFDYVSDNSLNNHLGNGKHFIIRSRGSGLVVEVQGRAAVPGTPLVTDFRGEYRNTCSHQLFYIDEVTGTIRTKLNNYCLDIDDDGIILNPYDPYAKTQQWQITGHKIHSRQDPDLVWTLASAGFEPGVNVVTGRYKSSELQQWDVRYLPAAPFYIVSQLNGKVVDIYDDDVHSGAKVIMYDRKATVCANQLWYEDEKGIIRSKLNGYVLDASSERVRMRPFDPTNTSHYWIIVGDRLQNKYDNRLVLDIVNENKKNGAPLCAYKFTGGDNQRWKFEYV